ncbi:unnamed protein product [Miscanthus lutarioriparius]|uniref:Uncharacterized protein n=1 Tax=Miscanthus lutarioriparius TaxID=422564 RepID=A0A811P805_9POAL|nr:unnamed protein product [Miscanthus lutarioriparius]
MARPGSRRACRPPPPASPEPRAAAATPPRPGSASRRRARRVRVQSPSRGRPPGSRPAAAGTPPPTPLRVRWPLGTGARSASCPGAGAAALSVREIAAALWRMQPPQAPPPPGPGTARRSRAQSSSKRPHTPSDHYYEKERKARVLMEEVCDELAKEIAEDKAEVEAMRSESMKIRDELEEEKKMLQMAEVWREERAQESWHQEPIQLVLKQTCSWRISQADIAISLAILNEAAEDDSGWETAHSEISEVCSTTAGRSRNKRSFVGLWRSSNTVDQKKMGSNTLNGRSSNARMSNVTESPDLKNSEVCDSPHITAQWRPDLLNPDIVRKL